MYQQTNVPDIFIYNDINPTLHSPNSTYEISFAQTEESLLDIEVFRNFISNAITRFRHSRTYKNYKAHLMQMGMDRCQVHGNIHSDEDNEMATIEMHHNILTIFDVAVIITNHMLKVQNSITTFDLVELLKMEHTNHRVCTVMLSKSAHQLVHADNDFVIPPSMCFGNWTEFLERYKLGITPDIAMKLLHYIKMVTTKCDISKKETLRLLSIRQTVLDWSGYNEQQGLYTQTDI